MRSTLPLLLFAALLWACSATERAALAEAEPPVGLPYFVQWSPDLAQGGQPDPELGYASLARLGFTTVISVDGAVPAVAAAEAEGLRYVHVPIGYDGVSDEAALWIAKAVESSPGPAYVHCHHGKHRGPAAAALARIALGQATREQALSDLAASGCSPDYAGLFRDVREFVPPTAEALAALDPDDLPSAVRPEGLLEAMVFVDHRVDSIRAASRVDWAAPHADIDPAHEVGMVENALRELLQSQERENDDDAFLELLRASHASAAELERTLRDGGEADAAFAGLLQTCGDCHAAYRD